MHEGLMLLSILYIHLNTSHPSNQHACVNVRSHSHQAQGDEVNARKDRIQYILKKENKKKRTRAWTCNRQSHFFSFSLTMSKAVTHHLQLEAKRRKSASCWVWAGRAPAEARWWKTPTLWLRCTWVLRLQRNTQKPQTESPKVERGRLQRETVTEITEPRKKNTVMFDNSVF